MDVTLNTSVYVLPLNESADDIVLNFKWNLLGDLVAQLQGKFREGWVTRFEPHVTDENIDSYLGLLIRSLRVQVAAMLPGGVLPAEMEAV